MHYLLKFEIDNEKGNQEIRNPEFGAKVQQLLGEIGAKAAYFTTINGCRGGYILVEINDASEIPQKGEPLFFWLNAKVELIPVMFPEDLAKAGPSIGAAVQTWG